MATESDVDIRSAHPYWAYPYNDIAVVHNGQITNYWLMRRQLERQGSASSPIAIPNCSRSTPRSISKRA